MPREKQEDQLSRALMRLGVTSRLKGAPQFHFWDIGLTGREVFLGLNKAMLAFYHMEMRAEAFSEPQRAAYEQLKTMYADPTVNSYTHRMLSEDTQTAAVRRLYVQYTYGGPDFTFSDPAETTRQIVEHFYPVMWPEFKDASGWELVREVVPAAQVARAEFVVYEEQRWLYDERSQRAAEVLAYRIQRVYEGGQLPASFATTEQERVIFEEYAAKLERRTNPRRWVQEQWAKLTRNPRRAAQGGKRRERNVHETGNGKQRPER